MKELSKIVSSFGESIFVTINQEAAKLGAINLGQGSPDFDGPAWVVQLAAQALNSGDEQRNQYAPNPGTPAFRQAVCRLYQKFYQIEYDPEYSITVTNGATQALFSCALALLNSGDEAVVIEPFYDSYIPSIRLVGAKAVPATLAAPDFRLEESQLRQAFSKKTKVVFLNNPHNPSGRVFTLQELNTLAELASEYDCYVISDEVYEFLTYDGAKHIPFASLPGMKERTVTISSAGKTFGLTGWKIGWACAPWELSRSIRLVQQFNSFGVNQPLQNAIAKAIAKLEDHLPTFRDQYDKKRNLMIRGLQKAGFDPIVPAGTYFVLCPIPDHINLTDTDYCHQLIKKKGVAAIPPSAFYLKSDDGKRHLRFCFAKSDSTLVRASKLLAS